MAATRSDFYPRPPRGGRPATPSARRATWAFSMAFFHAGNFYPRPPRGGRPVQRAGSWASGVFLATPSARRATAERQDADPPAEISIHALREEGDVAFFPVAHHCHNFYPRPPRGGRRYVQEFAAWVRRFLSTPSARRATFFSGGVFYWDEFLSTPSARRATPGLCPDAQAGRISIHALREEGDQKGEPITIPLNDFYPRPPRGGRLRSFRSLRLLGPFLSTPSARRATCGCLCQGSVRLISIHALREEGDTSKRRRSRTTCNFYPRPPRGGRLIFCFNSASAC